MGKSKGAEYKLDTLFNYYVDIIYYFHQLVNVLSVTYLGKLL